MESDAVAVNNRFQGYCADGDLNGVRTILNNEHDARLLEFTEPFPFKDGDIELQTHLGAACYFDHADTVEAIVTSKYYTPTLFYLAVNEGEVFVKRKLRVLKGVMKCPSKQLDPDRSKKTFSFTIMVEKAIEYDWVEGIGWLIKDPMFRDVKGTEKELECVLQWISTAVRYSKSDSLNCIFDYYEKMDRSLTSGTDYFFRREASEAYHDADLKVFKLLLVRGTVDADSFIRMATDMHKNSTGRFKYYTRHGFFIEDESMRDIAKENIHKMDQIIDDLIDDWDYAYDQLRMSVGHTHKNAGDIFALMIFFCDGFMRFEKE